MPLAPYSAAFAGCLQKQVVVLLAVLSVLAAPAAALPGPCCCAGLEAGDSVRSSCCSAHSECSCCAANAVSGRSSKDLPKVRLGLSCHGCSCEDCPANSPSAPPLAAADPPRQLEEADAGYLTPQPIDISPCVDAAIPSLADWRTRRDAAVQRPVRVLLCVWVI